MNENIGKDSGIYYAIYEGYCAKLYGKYPNSFDNAEIIRSYEGIYYSKLSNEFNPNYFLKIYLFNNYFCVETSEYRGDASFDSRISVDGKDGYLKFVRRLERANEWTATFNNEPIPINGAEWVRKKIRENNIRLYSLGHTDYIESKYFNIFLE